MITTILTLPQGDDSGDGATDPHARERALGLLRAWTGQWRSDIRDRWIVGPREIMVVAAPVAIAALPETVEHRSHARTTRWALLARTRAASRRLEGDAEVVVFPEGLSPSPSPSLSPSDLRVRILGPRRDAEDLVMVQTPFHRLTHFRVGKLDHPALSYRLEQLVDEGSYWPASTQAHEEAVALAAQLRDLQRGAEASP